MGKVSRRLRDVNQYFRCLYRFRPDATLPPAFTPRSPTVPLPDALHLSPTVAAALERLGWGADHPLLRDAAPTAARGHNLVMVVPPAPAYAVPALAGILSRLGQGERALVLAPPAQVQEWAATAHEVARGSGLRIEAAQGTARAARRLRAGEVDLLIASPAAAVALLRRSALEADRLAAVVLAWPEGWEDGEALTQLMGDVAKDVQRVLLLESLDRADELVERYARRALTVGGPPAETPAPAPIGPVRTVGVSWEHRAAALADLLELLDPASVAVWAVDRTRLGEIERAVGAGTPGVTVTSGDVPRAGLVVGFDPPTPERLRQLVSAGEVVLLMPPGTERYLERIAAPRRPLRLPGLLDSVITEAGARRAAVVRAIEGGRPDAALAVLAPLFERYDVGEVAAGLYQLWTTSTAAAAPAPDVPATSKIFVGIGKKDGATVNDLVAVLTKEVRVDRTRIGRVELKDAYALVEIPAQEAERIAGALNGTTIRRKRITARVDRGPARPARPPRPTRRG
jgi:ATP-dependent RNA helicase DeaD